MPDLDAEIFSTLLIVSAIALGFGFWSVIEASRTGIEAKYRI
jgi:hypothetical protein